MKNTTVTRNAIRKATQSLIKEIKSNSSSCSLRIDFDDNTALFADVSGSIAHGAMELELTYISLIKIKGSQDVEYSTISEWIGDEIDEAIKEINQESSYKAQEALYQREFAFNNY